MAHRQATWRLRGAEAVYVALGADNLPTAASLDTRPDGHLQWPLPAALRLTERLRRRARHRSGPTPPT